LENGSDRVPKQVILLLQIVSKINLVLSMIEGLNSQQKEKSSTRIGGAGLKVKVDSPPT
jgi:hypothetical protein